MNKLKIQLFSKLTSAKVATYYNNWTEKYMKGFGDIFQAKQGETIDQLIDYYIRQMSIKQGMRLLDAGCGVCGPAIEICKKADVTIDAVTVSEKQVEIAKEKISSAGLENKIQVSCNDFHHLETFIENSYDVVYFMESLVHSSDPEKALSQAYRLLKPDGTVYIKDLFEKTPYSGNEQKAIKYWVEHNNKNLCLNIIKKEDLLIILRHLGYQLEYCQLMRIPTNQNLGNRFVVDNNIMPDPIENSLPPYLEWYEIKALKPGPGIVNKM